MSKRKIYISIVLGVLWFVVVELIVVNQKEPLWGFFTLICIAAIAGVAAMRFVVEQKLILLMLPLQVLFLFVILFGNVQILYLPITSIASFYLFQYLLSRKTHGLIVLLFFLGISYVLSFVVLPKYLVKKYTLTSDHKNISFEYTSNKGNVFHIPGDKPIIIEYWNKGCGNCFKKMYMLEELKESLNDQVDFVCVYVDYKKGVRENLPHYEASLLRKQDIYNLDFAYDSVYYHYDKTRGLPQTMLVSPKGKVLYSDAGYVKGNKRAIIVKYKDVFREYLKD